MALFRWLLLAGLLPVAGAAQTVPVASSLPAVDLSDSYTLKAVETVAIGPELEEAVRSVLPVRVGDVITRQDLGRAARRVREVDDKLTFRASTEIVDGNPEARIRVSGLGVGPVPFKQPPRLRIRVDPEFPAGLAGRMTDVVKVNVVVGTDGAVRNPQVAAGDPELARIAINAAMQWVYDPGLIDEDPVDWPLTLTFLQPLRPLGILVPSPAPKPGTQQK
jgi:hypothetical protein